MLLPRAGAGMCARRRSNLSLASPRTSHQREGDPAVRVPFAALRGNLRCALQAGSAQTRLRLKQRAALIRLKLCSSARPEGTGSQTAIRPIAALGRGRRHERGAGGGAGFRAAQVLGSDHDFAQRNSCSDPNPGTVGAAHVLCHSCLRRRIQVPDNEQHLPARSSRWAHGGAVLQRSR